MPWICSYSARVVLSLILFCFGLGALGASQGEALQLLDGSIFNMKSNFWQYDRLFGERYLVLFRSTETQFIVISRDERDLSPIRQVSKPENSQMEFASDHEVFILSGSASTQREPQVQIVNLITLEVKKVDPKRIAAIPGFPWRWDARALSWIERRHQHVNVRVSYSAKWFPEGAVKTLKADLPTFIFDAQSSRLTVVSGQGQFRARKTFRLFNGKVKASKKLEVYLSPNGRFLLTRIFFRPGDQRGSLMDLIDLESKSVKHLETASDILESVDFSPDSKSVIIGYDRDQKNTFTLISLPSGESRILALPLGSAVVSSGSWNSTTEFCAVTEKDSGETVPKHLPHYGHYEYLCLDTAKGTMLKQYPLAHIDDLGWSFLLPGGFVVQGPTISVSNSQSTQIIAIRPHWVELKPTALVANVLGEGQMKSPALVDLAACKVEFSQSLWDSILRVADPLTPDNSLLWLQRFSKPGGFEVTQHAALMSRILAAGFYRKHPKEVQAALIGIYHRSPIFYYSLISAFPRVAHLRSHTNLGCLTAGERIKLSRDILDMITNEIHSSNFSILRIDKLLGVITNALTFKQRRNLSDTLAERMANEVNEQVDNEINPLALKVFRFSNHALKRQFNIIHNDFTDFVVAKTKVHTVVYYQIGSGDFLGAKRTRYGFYLKELKEIPVEKIRKEKSLQEEITTFYKTKEYMIQVDFDQKDQREISIDSVAPDYSSQLKDGILSGLMITNFQDAAYLANQYQGYFEEQGLVFEKASQIADTKKFLRERLTSPGGGVDLLIKEAHANGDTTSLLFVYQHSLWIKGFRERNGFRETFEILYPDPTVTENRTERISNRDFGDWIREREARGSSTLIYLNSSCWSIRKAENEMAQAASSNLVEIPTLTPASQFWQSESNAMKIIIDSLRAQKTYQEIRDQLKAKNDEYAQGHLDRYIFPGESDYDRLVNNVRDRAQIAFDIKIFERTGDRTFRIFEPGDVQSPQPSSSVSSKNEAQ